MSRVHLWDESELRKEKGKNTKSDVSRKWILHNKEILLRGKNRKGNSNFYTIKRFLVNTRTLILNCRNLGAYYLAPLSASCRYSVNNRLSLSSFPLQRYPLPVGICIFHGKALHLQSCNDHLKITFAIFRFFWELIQYHQADLRQTYFSFQFPSVNVLHYLRRDDFTINAQHCLLTKVALHLQKCKHLLAFYYRLRSRGYCI